MPWFVAFEGPIAAGKTTIAKNFAKAFGAHPLLEDFSNNEFLADFYKDRNRWALPMQLGFLMSRYCQFRSCAEYDLPIVSDHTFAKDIIFARLLLSGREFRLYETIHRTFNRPTKEPSLIVYLDASDEVLLSRIRQRNRPYETAISARYLRLVREAYKCELLNRPNVLIVHEDTSALDIKSIYEMSALYDRIFQSIPTTTA